MGRFVLSQKGTQWHFVLQAGNYEPILQSEMYESKSAAENGIASVVKNSQREGAFETKMTKNGQYHFVLKATNGQIVGQSEQYPTEAACNKGIASVIANGADAGTVEK